MQIVNPKKDRQATTIQTIITMLQIATLAMSLFNPRLQTPTAMATVTRVA